MAADLFGGGVQGSSRDSFSGVATDHSRMFIGVANVVNQNEGDGRQLLDDSHLPCVNHARFNSVSDGEETPYCLANTRTQILKDIDDWANDREGPCIFWMSGLAGTGKSTIARTVARTYDEKDRLGASFFFSIDYDDTRRSSNFVTTIAWQLAEADPALRDEIKQSIRQRSGIASYSLEDQWRRLVIDPLARVKIGPDQPPYILVIDALDECESTAGIATILRLLAQTPAPRSGMLRVFLTSRPDTTIEAVFDKIPEGRRRGFKLHSIDAEVVSHDIRIFLDHGFRDIAKNHLQEPDWPGTDKIETLTRKANGLFIWAAIACKFVGSDGRFSRQRLDQLLDDSISPDDPKSGLDRIYLTVLRSTVSGRLTPDEKGFIYTIVRLILGTMAVLVSPLPVNELGALFQSEHPSCRVKRSALHGINRLEIHLHLRHLSAIVDLPEDGLQPPRLHHPTLREFLLDEARCTEPLFHVEQRQTHLTLAGCCVSIMSQSWDKSPLGRGVFGFDNPGVTVTDVSRTQLEQWLPAGLRYACLHWVHHLQQSDGRIHANDMFDHFLRTHLLHWLEALTWMERFSDGVRAIAALESMSLNDSVRAFIRDAKRFTLCSRPTVHLHPLQVYVSALVFAPSGSIVRLSYAHEALHWMYQLPSITTNWGPTLLNLSSCVSLGRTLAFSPSGKLLASAANHEDCGVVETWDPATGELLQVFDVPGWAGYVVFLGEKETLAVASGSNRGGYNIQQRDPWTGECLQESSIPPWNGTYGAIALSKSGCVLSFTVKKDTIRVWDMASGICIQQMIDRKDQFLNVITVSQDASILASSSRNGCIKVWDICQGGCLHVLRSELQGALLRPALSILGNMLAVLSNNGILQIWDLVTCSLSHAWKVPSPADGSILVAGEALKISEDGNLIALVSYYHIQLWEINTGRCIRTIPGDSKCYKMALSPDGRMLATDAGNFVRLLDLRNPEPMKIHSDVEPSIFVDAIRFSPRGSLLAVRTLMDPELTIWNTATGKCSSNLTHAQGKLHLFDFEEAMRALLPDPKRHDCLDTWKKDENEDTPELVFTEDDRFLLSVSDQNLTLWDLESDRCLLTVDRKTKTAAASRTLNADIGLHEAIRIASGLLGYQENPGLLSATESSQPRVLRKDQWVRVGTQPLLRLPPEYKHFDAALAFRNRIAIAYSATQVLFLDVRSGS